MPTKRHLTGVRVLVLDVLADLGPSSEIEIVDEWAARRPDIGTAHRRQLPRMLDETLWRLVNLGWVQREGETYGLTDEGVRARASTPSSG